MKKIFSLLILLFAIAFVLASCMPGGNAGTGSGTGNGDGEKDDEPVSFDVTIILKGDGIDTPNLIVTATEGEDLEIPLTFDQGYTFKSASVDGEFDYERGIFVIPEIPISVSRVEFEAKVTQRYFFEAYLESGDTVSHPDDIYVEGTTITVTSGNTGATFIGWSFGKAFSKGGVIVSKDESFTFALNDASALNATKVKIYANYTSSNVYYYDLNGGTLNKNSVNMTDKTYYTAKASGNRVEVTLGAKYYEVVETASTFYDDATFTREGYVLIEYNTKPDGTGEGFNMGAKFQIDSITDGQPVLYCIWAKETDEQSFTFSDVSIYRPNGAKSTYVPYWNEHGVQITAYTGNEKTVVIPNKIGDKHVISIAAGAFKGKEVETVVFGRYVLEIEDGAFVNCTSLTTMYYSDGICYASDDLLDDASAKNFKNLRMNATMPPKLSNNDWGGIFAIKLTRVMSTADTNRIIMIGGSSIYEGLSTTYVEALINNSGLEETYSFINFGTTRTLTIMLYLDAIDHYTKEGDLVVMSPENHIRAMGSTSFVRDSYDDSEGMYPSLMRYLDISRYTGVFSSLSEFNLASRVNKNPTRYEDICKVGDGSKGSDRYGDDLSEYDKRSIMRNQFGCVSYTDTYTITFNEKVKSTSAPGWKDENRETADWTNPDNVTWCDFNDPKYADEVNRMLREIKGTGAKVYFAFAPVDGVGVSGSEWGVIPEVKADAKNWLTAYDKLVADTYTELDGLVGSSMDYIYHHNYFYDNVYHLNNYGRALRTYQFYIDMGSILGITDTVGYTELGTNFKGCLFESGVTDGKPKYKVDYIEAIERD